MAIKDKKRRYDDPRPGYTRQTFHVKLELLNRFKETAKAEGKTIIQAIEEALENWTYTETDDNE